MSSIPDLLGRLIPNFNEERKHLRELRSQYRRFIKDIERGDFIYTTETLDHFGYLSNQTEEACVNANDIIKRQNNSSGSKYEVKQNEEEVKEGINTAIQLINKQIRKSWIKQICLLTVLVVIGGLSVHHGIIGIGSLVG